jgi:uncharacterized Zn-binding protein involved in type VI secretion
MPAALTTASTLTCPHGGSVALRPGQTRVRVAGSPALTSQDVGTVTGCSFTLPGGKPSPCTTVRWTAGAAQVRVGRVPLLLTGSTAACHSPEQAPQGPPIVSATQPRGAGR